MNAALEKQASPSPARGSILLLVVIVLVGIASHALIRTAENFNGAALSLVAGMFALMACVPPLWIARFFSNGAVAQLAVTVWRLGILLPAVLWSMQQTAAARNYFCIALLACYFAALPLESWLLARQIRHS